MATKAKQAPKKRVKVVPNKHSAARPSQLEQRYAKLAELKEAIAKEEDAIARDRDDYVRAIWKEFNAQLSAAGATVDEAHRIVGYAGKKGRLAKAVAGKRVGDGKTVPALYMNPADPSETWSGRGRQARWLTDALAADSSKTLVDFLVAKPAGRGRK